MSKGVALRPGVAVYVVDEGLLLCGWDSSTLVACTPGAVKVWQAVEPMLRTGVDRELLRDRLPAAAVPVVDTFLAALDERAMLVEAGVRAEPPHLGYFAPDPSAASEVARRSVFGLAGDPALTGAVAATLAECGLRTGERGVRWEIYVGDAAGYRASARPPALAAIGCGDRVLVTSGSADAVEALDTEPDTCPSALTWAVARALLVERAHHLIAGTAAADRCALVTGARSHTLPLPPPLIDRDVRWMDVAGWTDGWRSPDTDALLTALAAVAVEPMIGALRGPLPEDLVQLPMARQRMWLAGERYEGAGIDQRGAGRDAVLTTARSQATAYSAPSRDNGCLSVAGDGLIDLLADAAGRSLAALAEPPTEEYVPLGNRSHRWLAALRDRTGVEPTVHSRSSGGVTLATAGVSGALTWGYGADAEVATEHALRGLLKRQVTDGDAADRVAVSHEPEAAEPLLRALLGASSLSSATATESLLRQRIPRLRVHVLATSGGWRAAAVALGKVEVAR